MKAVLNNIMEDSDYTYDSLAKQVKCSVGVLSKFIKQGEIVKFEIALKTVRILNPDNEKEFMLSYCLESDKPNHLKCAMEYADIHSNAELLGVLLDKCNNHNNKEIKEYATFYQLLYDRLIGNKESLDVFRSVISTRTAINELMVLKNLMEMYYHYHNKKFKNVDKLAEEFQHQLDSISEGFVKESFTVRYNQMVAYTQLHVHCNPIQAREVAKDSIEFGFGDYMDGFFYNIIATSYFDESLRDMNGYAAKTADSYSKVFGKSSSVVMGLTNRYNKLTMIMKSEFTTDYIEDAKDPIDLYIDGLANGNLFKLLECLVEFTKQGNIFFTKRIVKQLREMSCDESLIRSIQTI